MFYRSIVFASSTLATASAVVAAPTYDYVNIVSTGDALPGVDWTHAGTWFPEHSNGVTYFRANGSDIENETGVFRFTNGLIEPIVVSGDTVPGAGNPILAHGAPRPWGDEFTIGLTWESGLQTGPKYLSGTYQYRNGEFTQLATRTGTVLPGAPANTSNLIFHPTASVNGVIYAHATSSAAGGIRHHGIYRYDESGFSLLIDDSTPVPGSNGLTVDSVFNLDFDGDTLAFYGGDATAGNGMVVFDGENWEIFGSRADIDAELGHAEWGFQSGGPIYDNGVFVASIYTVNQLVDIDAIFLMDGSGAQRLVDTQTVSPDGGVFTRLGGTIAQREGEVLFDAETSLGTVGLFRTFNGALATIVKSGDVLDGKTVRAARFKGDSGISGDTIGFSVEFEDGTFGMYLAPVVRGSDQIVPVVSVTQVANGVRFDDVATQAWIDGLKLTDFEVEIVDELFPLSESFAALAIGEPSLITGITLPTGYGSLIEITADGEYLGTFGEGEQIDIVNLLGYGVARLSFSGFVVNGEQVGAEGVPIKLSYSTDTATVVALVPEPGSLILFAFAFACLGLRGEKARLES